MKRTMFWASLSLLFSYEKHHFNKNEFARKA